MNSKQIEAIAKAVVKAVDGNKTVKSNTKSGLGWWEKKFGFKTQSKGHKIKCSNGKTYPAVKGVTQDGTELTLVAIRGGSVYKKPF